MGNTQRAKRDFPQKSENEKNNRPLPPAVLIGPEMNPSGGNYAGRNSQDGNLMIHSH